jgi:Dolichyl-phosphate-mannose-protein mannosyltransferase
MSELVPTTTRDDDDSVNSAVPAAAATPSAPAAATSIVARFSPLRRALGDHAVGVTLAAAYVFWLLKTTRTLGFSRDESFYFDAATRYGQWFELLFNTPRAACTRASVDAYWAANHEHPSLMKALFALSNLFLFQRHKVFVDQSDAFRFPGMLMAGFGLWVVFLFGARTHSRLAGLAAAAALALMPRVFYHSHLACFDVPVMTMWALCIYVYYRAHEARNVWWALALGLVYGLTLETKHNSWMLPPLFLLHSALDGVMRTARTARDAHAHKKPRWYTYVPWHLLAMATIGPAVFVGLWPWLWNEPEARFREYVSFHVNHDYYNIEFLHQNFWGPPSPKAYMPFMIVATVPVITLALFGVGTVQRLRALLSTLSQLASPALLGKLPQQLNLNTLTAEHAEPAKSALDLLWLMGLTVPLAPFLLPATPIFGGTKHWFPAYPFLCLYAGVGFCTAQRILAAQLSPRHKWVTPALGALFAAAPIAETIHSHPFGLSSYSPIVGGTRGAATIGLYRQFWGFTTQSLNAYLTQTSKPGERIFIHDTTWAAFVQMQTEGRLPRGLVVVGDIRDADIAMVHHELHMIEVDSNIMTVFGHPDPDFVLAHDGVPIISVWRRNASRQ